MKSIPLFLLSLLFALLIFSCNHSTESNLPAVTNDTGQNNKSVSLTAATLTDCDYYVPKGSADSMIDKYKTDFSQPGIKDHYWIEECALMSIKKFLDDKKDEYDGVRFFLGKSKKLFNPKSLLLVVPTKKQLAPTATEKHLNCFGINIPAQGCTPSELQMNLSLTDQRNAINLFGKDYRKEALEGQRKPAGIEELSIGIWVSKCKIDKIVSLFTPANKLDGLMAVCAAYYEDDERRRAGEREFVVQSTFIFVPTRNKDTVWSVVPKPPQKWTKDAGFNHGELCPQICN